jgi:hypothetical protein
VRAGFAGLLAAGLIAGSGPALAQIDDGRGEGVMDRARPDYDAKGLPIGDLRLRPSLDIGANSDSNVYRTPSPKQDVFFTGTAAFDLTNDDPHDRLSLSGAITRTQYSKFDKESRTDWNLAGNTRLELGDASTVNGTLSYQVTHEPRYSPDEPGGAARPTQYSVGHSDASLDFHPGLFGLRVGYSYDRYNYDPTELTGGGGVVNNRDRDEGIAAANANVRYEVAQGTALELRGSYDTRNFDLRVDRNGVDRDSDGYTAGIGAQFYLTHLLHGEVFVGYAKQVFRAPLENVGGIDYGATLDWYPTELLTVHLNAQRRFDDTTLDGATVSDNQSVTLAADYELLRELILQTHVGFTDADYAGIARRDRYLEAGLSGRYFLNRYMRLDAAYTYSHRSSSVPGQDFADNAFNLGLHFQL